MPIAQSTADLLSTEEVLSMSDRVLVMHEGELTGELSRDQLSEEAVMQLATRSQHTTS